MFSLWFEMKPPTVAVDSLLVCNTYFIYQYNIAFLSYSYSCFDTVQFLFASLFCVHFILLTGSYKLCFDILEQAKLRLYRDLIASHGCKGLDLLQQMSA